MKNTPNAFRAEEGHPCGINVGDTERMISSVVGGLVLLFGLSRLSTTTIVTTLAGGALLYRGLTGHCGAYQALGMSTSCGLKNEGRGDAHHMPPAPREIMEVSLAATGESPNIAR
jgi:hypothetical protein